jgi:hypothetical protein
MISLAAKPGAWPTDLSVSKWPRSHSTDISAAPTSSNFLSAATNSRPKDEARRQGGELRQAARVDAAGLLRLMNISILVT